MKVLIAGIALPFTLMACYGTPVVDDPKCTNVDDAGNAIECPDAGTPEDAGISEDAGQ